MRGGVVVSVVAVRPVLEADGRGVIQQSSERSSSVP